MDPAACRRRFSLRGEHCLLARRRCPRVCLSLQAVLAGLGWLAGWQDGLVSLVTYRCQRAHRRGSGPPPPLRSLRCPGRVLTGVRVEKEGTAAVRPSARYALARRLHSAAGGKTTLAGLKFSLLPPPGHAEPAPASFLPSFPAGPTAEAPRRACFEVFSHMLVCAV